jgi:hypothetical protein
MTAEFDEAVKAKKEDLKEKVNELLEKERNRTYFILYC